MFDLSEHNSPGWHFSDSGLGECCWSLANVQSPSWSHARHGAFAPLKKGPRLLPCPLAAYPANSACVPPLFNPPQPVALLVSGKVQGLELLIQGLSGKF